MGPPGPIETAMADPMRNGDEHDQERKLPPPTSIAELRVVVDVECAGQPARLRLEHILGSGSDSGLLCLGRIPSQPQADRSLFPALSLSPEEVGALRQGLQALEAVSAQVDLGELEVSGDSEDEDP